MGIGVFFPGVKGLGREADHSSPSSAEVKKTWSYTSIPSCVCMAWCLIRHRIRFYEVVLIEAQVKLHLYFAYNDGEKYF
jgi:hypothetical protein